MAIDINIPIEDSVTDGSLNPVTSNAVFDALALKANSADLATVATSGDYNDLSNLPTIPAAQVNADWNATSGVAEILNKPTIPSVTGFVPYTGATNDVDLGVHDLTATQGTFSTSGNPDTLTVNHSSGSGKALTITKGGNGEGVYVNKTGGSGNAVTIIGDLEATNLKRTGGTSSQFLKANGSIDSTSYQPTLVSGTNIKTVNGNSLLGSGDLVISGGGGAIAVGTTAITSGTDGRVLFQAGGVVQQDSTLFWDNTNKRLGVGISLPQARLDVRAQGALSTDIAFRVRNSADSANIFEIRGDGNIALFQPGLYASNMKIFGSGNQTIAQFQSETFGSIALGSEATFDALTYGNVALGQRASTSGGGNSIAIGLNARAGNTANISIGPNSVCTGQYGVKIGQGQGPSGFGGINSIHLGRTTSGNNVEPDNVFMTYFNSQSSSTLTRSNGSFGLLGQQAYILGNGTGTYGLDKFMGDGGNTFVVRNHTSIPSLNIIDSFQQYSADITSGNAAPHFRTENGSVIKIYQETTGVGAATLTGGGGTALTDSDTFDGYTLKQIVKALRNQGLLA